MARVLRAHAAASQPVAVAVLAAVVAAVPVVAVAAE
jgi:hypothetical protein